MEEKPHLSIIIVNYRSRELLHRCVASIRAHVSEGSYEIIMVNNDAAPLDFPNATIINLTKNNGFGSACNVGAREARGEIIYFLNPDAEVLNDMHPIINYFKSNRSVGIIGSRIVDSKGEAEKWCAGYSAGFWDLIRNNLGFSRSKKILSSLKEIACERVSGCSLFIRKNIFDTLGGFDEKFFMYFEDDDLCKRARQEGWKIMYFSGWAVKHFGGKSFEEKQKQKKQYYDSQEYYFLKHFGKISANLLKLIRRVMLTR